jgi:lysophospholipase
LRRFLTLSLLLCFLVTACLSASGGRDTAGAADLRGTFGKEEIRKLKTEMSPVDSRGWLPGEGEEALLRFFAPRGLPGSFRLATFLSGERRLALYHFRPDREEPAGFIYILHGYLDHTLSNVRQIADLRHQGYELVGFDLPGHGLSEGEPVDIDDFAEYARAFEDLLELDLPGEGRGASVVAHSTGCSTVIEYLRSGENLFDRIVLASPLVYSAGWWITGFGISMAEPFSDHIFRRFSASSRDKEYMDFVRNRDPFQSREVPFSWVKAYLSWNRDIRSQPPREDLVFHILQGDRDSVVDHRMNIPFLLESYTGSRVYYYEDALHSLFNEPEPVREAVFRDILGILESREQ